MDGVICTGNTTTIAAVVLLGQHNRKAGAKRIRFVGLDAIDPRVTDAIRDGSVDMTLAQNPFGHGYISCALLDLMLHGLAAEDELSIHRRRLRAGDERERGFVSEGH